MEKIKMQDKILARVGTLTVTENDVNGLILNLGQRGQAYNSPEGRKAVLNQIINNKLLLLDARRNLYEAEPAFKEELQRIKENLLSSYAAQKIFSTVTVSDSEAEKYYNENKEQFTEGEKVNASHILVDSEELAREIYSKIESGEISFEDAAKEYSSCPSKESGGSLGEFGRGQMVGEFDKAVFEMTPGEITKEPVKTQFGYHLIKLVSKRDAQPAPFSEIKEEIKGALISEKQRKAYESKINQLKILYPVDLF